MYPTDSTCVMCAAMYIGYVVVRIGSRRVSLFCCELMSLLESCLAMRRGLSNPTRPSLPGPHRDPRISTEVQSASVMRMSPTSALLTPTAFQEECSRRDTLSVIMRPLVSLPIYPDFLEFLTGMDSPTSRLNRGTRGFAKGTTPFQVRDPTSVANSGTRGQADRYRASDEKCLPSVCRVIQTPL